MATPQSMTRDQLASLAKSYFQAVDANDVDLVLSHFAPDATLTVQTDHVTFTGLDELRQMFSGFITNSKQMLHEVKSIVADEKTGKVATQQYFTGESLEGTQSEMLNCNFFDVNADGKFSRVVIWMAGKNPLK
ncbi:NTF2-like protein [Aspergillus avenaceus]|uniref:NTF2-like protein n=1 Tax=Aspergillus avenaceus TaxID=36643 RepID=A0A5N6TRU2_ASPAV|nr:NTF2-like protein [Aspergillus avenaceus]